MNISIWGQENILDKNLMDKICSEMEWMVDHEDRVTFWFYGQENCDRFSYILMEIFWQSAYAIRKQHPEKKIEFIKIIDKEEKKLQETDDTSKPFGLQRFDQYVCSKRTLRTYNDYIRFIEPLDYVLCYFYPEIDTTYTTMPIPDKSIDLTTVEIRARINEIASTLPEKQKQVYMDRMAGKPIMETARDIGLSRSRIGQIYREAVFAILKNIESEKPIFPKDFLDGMYLHQLQKALKDNKLPITDYEKQCLLEDHHYHYHAQIIHMWRDKEGMLCVAYNNEFWRRYEVPTDDKMYLR